MPLTDEQSVATKIVKFGDGSGPSVLNYHISLPGSVSGRRIVRLELPDTITATDYIVPAPSVRPKRPYELIKNGAVWSYDKMAALDGFFKDLTDVVDARNGVLRMAIAMTRIVLAAENSGSVESKLVDSRKEEIRKKIEHGIMGFGNRQWGQAALGAHMDELISSWYESYRQGLELGNVGTLQRSGDNYTFAVAMSEISTAVTNRDPAFYVIEYYSISSFLGDYGLGKTLTTFSLLPGEETKVYMKTWRTETETSKIATSVVDSYTSEAESALKTDIRSETTTKDSLADKFAWEVKAQAEVSIGVFKGKVEGGASGSHQAARDTFAGHIENAVKQHAFKASSNRSNSVTAERTSTATTGVENSTERLIKNVNLRRVLNFVFRELNQQYTCKTHLTNIKVAYFDGIGVWDEVDLVNLRELLERNLANDNAIDAVGKLILRLAAMGVDYKGTPRTLIDKLSVSDDGTFTRSDVVLNAGNLEPPDKNRTFMYQFKRGTIGQEDAALTTKVDGHLVRNFSVTMRTEAIVCEALLGQADALDPYALTSQALDSSNKELANERTKVAIETLKAIDDPIERAKAYNLMFIQQPVTRP